jgi:hypothetical protein
VNIPIEPSADQRQAALGLRGMYLALVQSGFTEAEAMHLIAQMLLANGGRS